MEILLLLGAAFLAFSNGANDNFKGFATVWGSETLSYRRALTLATIATVLGSAVSIVFADTLVQQFSGKGLVPNDIAGSPGFILSVGIGAASTVMIATRMGLPISTTHALIGGLVGAGLMQGTRIVNFGKLVSTFLMPLLVSPFLAATLGYVAYRLMRLRRTENDCACIVATEATVQISDIGTASYHRMGPPRVVIDSDAQCNRITTTVVRVSISAWQDRLHTLSAAAICFARGVNDTPKLVALLLAARLFNAQVSAMVIAIVMALGGLLLSRRVAQTMSQRMTSMDHTQGLAANLISATLILFASKFGLPVSTTHISVGSIAGTGASARTLDWATLRNILLSWVATLPLAGLIAAAAAALLSSGA
ncbi:MAG: inorganic phosphate transporter [Steroidobacteraceae bacterium]